MIFETINIRGNEHEVNFSYVTKIEYSTICNPTGHSDCGEKGDTVLIVSIAHSADWLKIACDYDGNDVTEAFLKAYKEWGYRAK